MSWPIGAIGRGHDLIDEAANGDLESKQPVIPMLRPLQPLLFQEVRRWRNRKAVGFNDGGRLFAQLGEIDSFVEGLFGKIGKATVEPARGIELGAKVDTLDNRERDGLSVLPQVFFLLFASSGFLPSQGSAV